MTVTVKSVLFVDYDSLYLSLRARDPGMARRFASRPGAWIDAIESGQLGAPAHGEPAARRVLMRRCYADPRLLGKARGAFASHGFQIVDCPPLPGRERNSAEIQMVLDTVDALGHQTGFEEFILLSADSDLTPVIFRLRSYNRATTIYATATTSAGYRAIADGVIDESGLMTALAATADAEAPETEEIDEESAATRPAGERDDLAALARRNPQATNVPLFSPKVYAELFRALAQEIAENGYHFHATAENVSARLVAAGRNASRRQIAFVVKGLALKGHVFSTTDTAEKLGEVFKEQVFYLAKSAGLEIDDPAEAQIRAWIVGRSAAHAAPPPPSAPLAEPKPPETAGPKLAPIPSPPPMPPAEAAPNLRPISIKPALVPQPIRPIAVRPAPPEPPVAADHPPAGEGAARRPVERTAPLPVSPGPAVAPTAAAHPPAIVAPPKPYPSREAPQDEIGARAPIAPPRPRQPSQIAAPEEPKAEPQLPARVVSTIRPPAPRGSVPVAVRPPARRSIAPPEGSREPGKDAIESSILAAIAQAVDVLVIEDEVDKTSPPAASPEPAPAPAPKPAAAAPLADDGDIGDEIQRILAAYSQSRKPGGGK